jgi:1-deoxy-D-xylulose-5-phosphate synthase
MDFTPLELGKAEVLKKGEDFTIIALGSVVAACLRARELLLEKGLYGTVINARFAKPLDTELFSELSKKSKYIFTVEEGVLRGGFGSAVSEEIDRPVLKIGLPAEFIPHGRRGELLEKYGLGSQGIANKIEAAIWQK